MTTPDAGQRLIDLTGSCRVWQERHFLVGDSGHQYAVVLRSGYGGYVYGGLLFSTLEEAKSAAEADLKLRNEQP